MKQYEVQIEVISELTGDSIGLVRKVVLLLRSMAPANILEIMDYDLSGKDIEKARRSFRSSPTLVSWYREGLVHITELEAKDSSVQ